MKSDPGSSTPRSGAEFDAATILLHAINFHPEMIGCGKYSSELVSFLSARGYRVEVVTAPPHYPGWQVRAPYSAFAYKRDAYHGSRLYRCPILTRRNGRGIWRLIGPMSFAVLAAPVVIWRALAVRPKVILCVEPTLLCAPAALLAAKLAGARSVLHVQDLEMEAAFAVGHLKGSFLKRLAGTIERALIRRFTKVVTISGKMKAALTAKELAPDRVEIIRNWVQPPAGATPDGANYRRELAIAPEHKVVLYSGHIGIKQAIDSIVEAAGRLRDRLDIMFVIAGEGPEKERLVREAADLPRMRFLPLQPAERLHEFLAFADCHVLPQQKGTADLVLPSKLGGMLASGRPIVAMADPGTEMAEILEGAALIIGSDDAGGMARAIEQALDGDHAVMTAKALNLADQLHADRVLPAFEALLLDRPMRETGMRVSTGRRAFAASHRQGAI